MSLILKIAIKVKVTKEKVIKVKATKNKIVGKKSLAMLKRVVTKIVIDKKLANLIVNRPLL